jgi:glycosyltransferase involved in cell wall biosynthesis
VFDSFLPWTPKRLAALTQQELAVLFAPSANVVQDQNIDISNLMVLLYSKLFANVDLAKFRNRQALVEWYQVLGRYVFNIDQLENHISATSQEKQALETNQYGFNLIGYARSVTGLGEDVRQLATILGQLDIPFSLIVVGHPADSLQYAKLPNQSHVAKYKTSIFCMNLIEFEKLFGIYDDINKTFGKIILQAPWELPKLPKIPQSIMQCVDKFWAISDFVKNAFEADGFNNVVKVPLICRSPLENETLVIQGVQKRAFTFLYIFDAGSYWSRKNPEITVDSFQNAFKLGEKVRLIFKVTNANQSRQFLTFREKCRSDPRIHFITEYQSEMQIAKLFSHADCYVSLHRSEGFGRTLAEASLHAKPVIATNWSGSCDILPQESELLVDYTLVTLQQGDYPFAESQHWADADLTDATEKMFRVFNLPKTQLEAIGQLNRDFVKARYTHSATKDFYKNLFSSMLSDSRLGN